MKLVFPFPLWLWCFRSTWTTPAIQWRLKTQQENSVRVPGFGEGRDSQRKGVGTKALLAKAEGVLKPLWSWIRGRNGRKLRIPISFFSLSSFSRYTKRLSLLGELPKPRQEQLLVPDCHSIRDMPRLVLNPHQLPNSKKAGKMQFSSTFCIHSL